MDFWPQKIGVAWKSSKFMRGSLCVSVCVQVWTRECTCVYVFVLVNMCVWVCVSVCVYSIICVCAVYMLCMCVCVHARARVSVGLYVSYKCEL